MPGYCNEISLVLKIEFQGTHTCTQIYMHTYIYGTLCYIAHAAADWLTRRRLEATLCGIRAAFVYANHSNGNIIPQ